MVKIQNQESKEEKKLLKPKNDIVFQSLFNKDNEKITKAFVQALLGEKIESLIINDNKYLLREKTEDRLGILDLEVDVNNNEKVDVEIQLIEQKNFAERLLFYFSRLYAKQIKKGYDYTQAKRVVLIAIVDYELDLTKKIKEMETIWQLREKEHPELLLTNSIEICIIEINKVKRMYELNKNDPKTQWLLFLDDPNTKEVRKIMEENKDIEEATIIVRQMSEDEKMERIAFLREKAIMDEKEYYRTAMEKGMKQGKIEIAKKLKKMNKSNEEIMAITGLSEEELNNI